MSLVLFKRFLKSTLKLSVAFLYPRYRNNTFGWLHFIITINKFLNTYLHVSQDLDISFDMRCHAKVVVTSINVFFSIVFLVHISSIGYHTLYPEVPEIVVSKKNLNEIDFPITFRICAYDLKDTVSRYKSFGYAHYGDYFRGRSMFNDTLYGWAGHDQNGSVLGNVEGEMMSKIFPSTSLTCILVSSSNKL